MIILGYSGFTRDVHEPGRISPLARVGLDANALFRFHDGDAPFQLFPLSFFGHDAAAALIVDGEVVACAAEERFTRHKHSLNLAGNTLLPGRAARWCLDNAGIKADDVDAAAFYCDFRDSDVTERLALLAPHLPDEEKEALHAAYSETYAAMLSPTAVERQYERMLGSSPRRLIPVRHHNAHAASAFYASGFDEALILTIDGTGELESSLLATGRNGMITERRRVMLPTSLGALYLIITVYLGFRSLGDEYKVMGLAAYGDPARYRSLFDTLVVLRDNGCYETSLIANRRLSEILESALGQPRHPDEAVTQRHADVAAGLQDAVQRAVLHTLTDARRETGMTNLCLAGGVALNCALNGAIACSGLFRNIFVQPAANDEGGSIGAALQVHQQLSAGKTVKARRWDHVFFGPGYDRREILAALAVHSEELIWQPSEDIATEAAAVLSQGKIVGWFQGYMEFGPRALGHRSILADPRDPRMKDRLNELVKHREPFRPFAPAVLEEEASAWFDMANLDRSPFMLIAMPVRREKRNRIPAVIHYDGTARVQTVSRRTDSLFHQLITEFGRITGVPVVLNTSFNVNREPIVCTPEDAIRCFLHTHIDWLALGDVVVRRRRTCET